MPMSDQSISGPASTLLEGPYPNIGSCLETCDGALEFNEGIQFDDRVQDGPSLQQTSNDGFTYINNTGTGLLSAGSDDISQGQDHLQFPQDVGGDNTKTEIERQISIVQDARQRVLQRAQEMWEDIVALQRSLKVMKKG